MIQFVFTILNLVYLCLSLQSGTRREKIGSHSLRLQRAGEGMQILFWQEMLCLDVVRLNLSLISQTVHIDAAVFPGLRIHFGIYLHPATTFGNGESGSISGAVCLNVSTDSDTARYTYLLHQRRVKHGGNEVKMIGACLQIYICLQTVHIRHVTQVTICTQFEGCWQRQFQARERCLLRISLERTFYLHRIEWPFLLHGTWEGIACKEEQI